MTHVAGQQPEHRSEAPRRRRRAAVFASLVAHVVVLAIIGLNVPRPVYREPPPLKTANIWLMPRLTPEQHKPAEHAVVRAPPHPISTPKPSPPAPRPSPIQNAATAATAATAAPGKAAPVVGVPPGPPPNAGIEGGQGMRDVLRTTVGCDADHVLHLTPAEQARCNQLVGEMARKQPSFVGIDPLKRGRFDAQADADERRRAAHEGPMESPVDCNLYANCLPPSAIKHVPF
jgi:hypothetical protein